MVFIFDIKFPEFLEFVDRFQAVFVFDKRMNIRVKPVSTYKISLLKKILKRVKDAVCAADVHEQFFHR